MAKYTVYKIVNLINSKYYIGIHKTKNLQDSYMGSGRLISAAIKKYGKENFSKEILYVYNTLHEAANKEKELVNPNDPMIYNIKHGGFGGFDHINSLQLNVHYGERSEQTKMKMKENHWSKSESKESIKQKISRSGARLSTSQKENHSDTMKKKFLDLEYKKKFQKMVSVDGILFNSYKDAANHFGLSGSTVSYRVKSDRFRGWHPYKDDA